jgi:hypothetical protein
MRDIIKYWIVLPDCDVYYYEDKKEPELIGFNSTSDVLTYYSENNINEGVTRNDINASEIRSVKKFVDNEIYEFSYRVSKGFTPEWKFDIQEDQITPVVCIEGIRADNRLPIYTNEKDHFEYMYRQRGDICAILSVRNNRQFRTTVSRSNLERDDEYYKVGKICIDFLLEHLEKEVKRIADGSGNPLSRASTAGNWIFNSINHYLSSEMYDYLIKKFSEIPVIVIEENVINETGVNVSRKLICSNELNSVQTFWTIESRLVTSLGIISRDLGKELSLNKFLTTLAPEFCDQRIANLIPDADQFVSEILSSHIVGKCEFSRINQQTIVKWEKRKENEFYDLEKREDDSSFSSKDVSDLLKDNILYLGEMKHGHEMSPKDAINTLYRVQVAELDGDLPSVFGIITDVVVILHPDCVVADLWNVLKNLAIKYMGKNEIFSELLLCTDMFKRILIDIDKSVFIRSSYHYTNKHDEINGVWKELQKKIEIINLDELSSFKKYEKWDILELIGSEENWFNASDYYWDWSSEFYDR